MDIFVRHVPEAATTKDIKRFFSEPFSLTGVGEDFHVEKIRNKPLAVITVLDGSKAKHFLSIYGIPQNAPRGARADRALHWNGEVVLCSKSRDEPSVQSIQSLAYEASRRTQKPAVEATNLTQVSQHNTKTTRFATSGLACGTWDYDRGQLVFISHFTNAKQGTISFGAKGAVIVFGADANQQSRVDLEYHNCNNIVVSRSYEQADVTFTFRLAPKFYSIQSHDPLVAALMAMTLGPERTNLTKPNKLRLGCINKEHEKVAGTCFVYRITLSNYSKLGSVRSLLERDAKSAPLFTLAAPTRFPLETLESGFIRLSYELTDASLYGSVPYSLRYQVLRLATNGVLVPNVVRRLLGKVWEIFKTYGYDAALSATARLYRQVPFAGPDTQGHELSLTALMQMLDEFASAYDQYQHNPQNPYELVKRHQHINLIHKVTITPSGTYLEAPEPEPTNRVLRRYATHSDHFIRVVFQDEDRSPIRYDPRADHTQVFHERFKGVLNGNILVAGRSFSFLGFSHSSLRSQSCWFMAPIYHEGSLRLPEHILRELGDFSHIRVPAKCAARIGQNFTDTNTSVDLAEDNVLETHIVTRNGYDFSDGVGTISEDLLRSVWQVYGTRRALKPTALQIRFQGYKGMVSLDSRLRGRRIMLRSNMKKFDSAGAWNLEICGAAFKPLPMMLNRPLIKILEDLEVSETALLDLQQQAINRLRYITSSNAVNAASFLEEMDTPKATCMPTLIRLLNAIGLDYRQDHFLFQVVEMAVVSQLRDIKYRGRIPVSSGYTLYGIMDETGYLKEGEVYVVTESGPAGGRRELIKNGIAVTRSPALHPGDVQLVNAITVPANSPLKRLSNVIAFSQHGARDLPSQLSGGDLDGDIYNIIFDPALIPPTTYHAAEYPRVSAAELDRPVTRKDMSDFFVTFMETDQLGMISSLHLQIADQRPEGTLNPDCLKLAAMASTAVDFSKTGIAVNIKQCPRNNRLRPDFMAPSPRVFVSESGHLDLEDEGEEDDPAFEDLDVEKRTKRYYQSEKVLGKLYRAIDEEQFLAKLQRDRQAVLPISKETLLATVLDYMKAFAKQYLIEFDHQSNLARDIKASYEESLIDILHIYAPSANMPISEHEAFAGTILGRKGGAQNKSLRELGQTMRERFSTIVKYNVMRIVNGDERMQGVSDLDTLYDENLDREIEALPRAIACLKVAVEEKGLYDRRLGELQSFKYIAAGVALKELERYAITTLGSYALPRV